MIWNVVFANKSRKLGWIWIKLGRWGRGLKRLSLGRFQRNRAMRFGENAKKWVAEAFFCHVNHAPLLPLSLDRFPQNFPRTCVQVVSRDTWFHIPERFPWRNQISRKTLFFRVPYLCSAYGSREMFCDAYTLSIPLWTSLRCIFPGWLLLRDVPFSTYLPPKVTISAMGIPGWGHSSGIFYTLMDWNRLVFVWMIIWSYCGVSVCKQTFCYISFRSYCSGEDFV